ncbi:MAG: ribonuclease HI family protein [Nanoarchaeota archaeon]|jgi:ribonuclease HI|nr:ribonuclease HI family protein [Nanoarchaeota archaeon]
MITTNSDGGARGNPGPAGIGLIIRDGDKILEEYGAFIGTATNNVAEYKGIIKALELVSKYTQGEITCIMDSELIIKQLLGEYRVKNPRMKELFLEVQKLQNRFDKIHYVHVKRNQKYQKMADYMVNKALDEKLGKN